MGHSSNNRPVTARARNSQSCNLEGNNRPGTAGARNPRSCNLEGSSQDLPRSTKLDYLRRGILLTFRRTSQIFGPSSSSTNNTSTSLWGFENSQTSGVRRGEEELRVGQALDLDAANLRVFTLPELRTATKNFSADTVIGEGGFGKIYKGRIKEKTATNRGAKLTIAVKKLNPESVQGVQEWQTEVNILGRLSHPNIIKLLGFGREEGELLLVYECMPRGSLDNHLFGSANVQPLSWDTRLKVMIGVARALSFLHSLEEKIIFRDVKTSNILLDKTYTAKLSDFGLAKYGPAVDHSHVTQLMGTYGYAAPEYMATGHLYVKSDVYGFGIVVMEMLTGKRISDISSNLGQKKPLIHWFKSNLLNREQMRSTMDAKLEGKYPSKLALQLARLTLKCILDDPKVRPSMKEVVEKLEKIEAANEKVAHKS